MKKFLSLTILLCAFATGMFAKTELLAPATPQTALNLLIQGNKRYVDDQLLHPRRDLYRRESLVAAQEPFAIILGCSDSRVSPEVIFDQGIGDLFVVRVAGNVVSQVELESIEYSAVILHSSIILVLGHENCGAVKAVLTDNTKDIQTIANYIEPAVAATKGKPGDPLTNAVKENVKRMVAQLKENPVIGDLIRQNKINVVGGYYNLATGQVDLLN